MGTPVKGVNSPSLGGVQKCHPDWKIIFPYISFTWDLHSIQFQPKKTTYIPED